jgi:hypothetical protein
MGLPCRSYFLPSNSLRQFGDKFSPSREETGKKQKKSSDKFDAFNRKVIQDLRQNALL